MASRAEGEIREVLVAALLENSRQLGKVYSLDPEMKKKPREIVELEGAANEGAVGNIRCALRALLDGVIPNSPTVSRQAAGSLRSLARENPNFSSYVLEHVNEVIFELQERAASKIFQDVETEVRLKDSEDLAKLVEKRGGVYAYSLPHYLNYPCKEDPDRFWFKVGRTNGNFVDRVIESHRKTGLPEDPIIRRTYFSSILNPAEMEDKFHRMLKASGLQTDARYAGVEWFATTEDQLDAIAELLDFEITKPQENEQP